MAKFTSARHFAANCVQHFRVVYTVVRRSLSGAIAYYIVGKIPEVLHTDATKHQSE
jgi:hypothetical protein